MYIEISETKTKNYRYEELQRRRRNHRDDEAKRDLLLHYRMYIENENTIYILKNENHMLVYNRLLQSGSNWNPISEIANGRHTDITGCDLCKLPYTSQKLS